MTSQRMIDKDDSTDGFSCFIQSLPAVKMNQLLKMIFFRLQYIPIFSLEKNSSQDHFWIKHLKFSPWLDE